MKSNSFVYTTRLLITILFVCYIGNNTVNANMQAQISSICNAEHIVDNLKSINFNNYEEGDTFKFPMKSLHLSWVRAPQHINNPKAILLESKNPIKISNKELIEAGLSIDDLKSATSKDSEDRIWIIRDCFLNNGEHYLLVGMNPVEWDYANDCLLVFQNLKFQINSCDYIDNVLGNRSNKNELDFGGINYVSTNDMFYEVSADEMFKERRSSSYYVIITPQKFERFLMPLIKWKEQKGLEVKVGIVEQILQDPNFKIGSNDDCFDKESSVREWLKSLYKSFGGFDCLIIGDYRSDAPIRKYYLGNKSSDDYSWDDYNDNDAYYPTDNYFSDLVSDWNMELMESGYYSTSVARADYNPSIRVGRLLCNGQQDICRYVDKLILYELFPGRGDTQYLKRGCLVRHADAVKYSSRDFSVFTNQSSFNVECIDDNSASAYDELYPKPDDVLQAVGRSGISSINVHANPQCFIIATCIPKNWLYNVILARSDYNNMIGTNINHIGMDVLDNFDSPGIIYTNGCHAAPFDAITNFHKTDYNLASSYTVAGKYGGVSVLANTRAGNFGSGARLEKEFGKALRPGRTIGEAINIAKINYPLPDPFIISKLNLIGDPNLEIWLDNLKENDFSLSTEGDNLVLSGLDTLDYRYGIKYRDIQNQGWVTSASPENRLDLSSLGIESSSNGIGSLFLRNGSYFPIAILFTKGQLVTDQSDIFWCVDAKANGQSINDSTHESALHLNLGSGTNIELNILRDFYSSSGISLQDGANLKIKADNKVVLDGDAVLPDSKLIVDADEIVIKRNFVVKLGGEAYFNANN